MDLIPMPSALLSHNLLAQAVRQKHKDKTMRVSGLSGR